MKKSVLLGVVCTVFIGLGGSVYAYGDGGGECAAKKERKVRAKVGHVMKKIEVTDQQRAAIEDEYRFDTILKHPSCSVKKSHQMSNRPSIER